MIKWQLSVKTLRTSKQKYYKEVISLKKIFSQMFEKGFPFLLEAKNN